MLKEADLSKSWPDYTGGSNVKTALDFIEKKFLEKVGLDINYD